jgi:hypothetical protein
VEEDHTDGDYGEYDEDEDDDDYFYGYDSAEDDVHGYDAAEDDVHGYDAAEDDVHGYDAAEYDVHGYDAAEYDIHGYDAAEDDVHGYDAAEDDVHGYEYDSGDDAALSVPDFLSIAPEREHQVVSPSLPFLPRDVYRSICLKHCSDGLLVCLCWKVAPTNESDYVVCNPATQQWVIVPGNGHRHRSIMPLHLAADPASASGHFHLFAILENDLGCIAGVDIYSSETQAWSHKKTGWAEDAELFMLPHSAFLHGMLHLVSMNKSIVAVDTKGSTWKTICLPQDMEPSYLCWNVAFIGVSQGRLYYVNNSKKNNYTLTVWMLQGNDNWIAKHTIPAQALFGPRDPHMYHSFLVAIHPDCNTIFFTVKEDQKLMAYDMDRGETRVCGILSSGGWQINPYLPYVPSWRSLPL